ncbi:fluoride efflux transporter FluC [Billgrantia kenyensis]|uniref:Fluoride-specific ion channel FluC n=1 Tax=Billgrantia kenyensis TaxID=321266 RepID=A0A7W0AE61_9GAMM|nr:CrcB family protein [Halomonas kenyensis]MBA2779753.1 CrcB family protein [Halomonas kenyensis]MCG6662154.1 camphor resistance protein CrcB [Halomonas kenyensis]
MTMLLMVAVGGALGGMLRLAVSNLLARLAGAGFPWGTLVVNLSGALLAGILAGSFGVPHGEAAAAWLFLVIGVLGGYTTVSSLSLQSLALWQSGRHGAALANLSLTLGAGLALAALGWWLGGGVL